MGGEDSILVSFFIGELCITRGHRLLPLYTWSDFPLCWSLSGGFSLFFITPKERQRGYLQEIPLELEGLPSHLVHLIARPSSNGQVTNEVPALELERTNVHESHAVPCFPLGMKRVTASISAAIPAESIIQASVGRFDRG